MTIAAPIGERQIVGGVSLAAAAAACAVIEKTLHPDRTDRSSDAIQIRWPNDLLIGGRKVGGVLGEVIWTGDRQTLLLGVGINVNNPIDTDAHALRTPAASLAGFAGQAVDLRRFVDTMSTAVADSIEQFLDDGLTDQARAQIDARLADIGQRVRLEGGPGPVVGVLVGVGPGGSLVIEIDGVHRSFVSGELSCRGLGQTPAD